MAERSSVEQHAARVEALLAGVLSLGSEQIALDGALGRVTAGPILSPVDLPLFRNSQMDGFAVRAIDVSTVPATLPVVGQIPARASQPNPLQPGTAVKIMTGAPVPLGADAVVPVEDTGAATGEPERASVTIVRSRVAGEYVRERGSDLRAGAQLLPGGLILAPRHLAALAAAGLAGLEVRSRVRVAIVTTGTELVAPGTAPQPGQTFDSNAAALIALVTEAGATVTFRAHVMDDAAQLVATLHEARLVADFTITSGGISMGDYEVVREVLEDRASSAPAGPIVDATVGTIAMQPGGPQATAIFDGMPLICFPGNPVSTQISFAVFLAPLLRRAAGLHARTTSERTLTVPVTSFAGRRQFLRGCAVGDTEVEPVAAPGSHLVAGMASADLMIDIPTATTDLEAGESVVTWAL